MKKTLIFLVMLCAMFVTAVHAESPLQNRAFGGVFFDESRYAVKGYSLQDWNSSIGIFAGYRWNEFGMQMSAQYIRPYHFLETNGNEYYLHGSNYALDALYFLRLYNQLELKSFVGAGLLNNTFKITQNGTRNTKSNTGIGARIGTGLQYHFSDHVIGDVMVKAQAPGNKLWKNIVGVSVGVGYVL